ncbi:MAG: aminotransferase class III-fold pyridoxal phosphate-dependent enzyme, partial [Proteobacteria bacterium]|nr:aminotransferase class III-fold pyridoxal phosphate-dependent enzyme [Pseudomonadota bacterium]
NMVAEAKKNNVTVIADEIQCGYYRHGHLSVSIQNGYDPDLLLFSKSLTNGLFPFSLILYRNQLKRAFTENFYLAHTFQTSALGCYAALSVAKYIDESPIQEMCDEINRILEELSAQLSKYSCIKNIFVTGPSISFEVVGFPGKALVNECLE